MSNREKSYQIQFGKSSINKMLRIKMLKLKIKIKMEKIKFN